MGFALPNGAHVYIAKKYGEADIIVSATNDKETVLTLDGAHTQKAGAIVHVNSGWSGLDELIARVKAVDATTITLEGINTTNIDKFPEGGAVGSIRIVEEWIEISQITDVANAGGEQQNIQIQFLADDTQRNVNTFKNARSQTYTIAHDSSLPFYPVLTSADETQDTLASYMYVPKAKENRYWSSKVSFNETPNTAVNAVETVTAVLNLQSPAMVFYKLTKGGAEAEVQKGVAVIKAAAAQKAAAATPAPPATEE